VLIALQHRFVDGIEAMVNTGFYPSIGTENRTEERGPAVVAGLVCA